MKLKDKISLYIKQIEGRKLQKAFPGISHCKRCLHIWKVQDNNGNRAIYGVEPKSLLYTPSRGHFALCEGCWNETTLDEKINYYTQHQDIKDNPENKKFIINNILKQSGENPEMYFRKQKLKRITK